MKICHVSTLHKAFDIRIFKKQCCSLADLGHNVDFLVNAPESVVEKQVQIMPLKKRTNVLMRLLLNHPKVFWHCLKNKYDIYHFHDPELLFVCFLLKISGKTVVYDMHENFPKQLSQKSINPIVKKIVASFWYLLERIALKMIPVVFAETSYKKDYLFVKKHTDILNMPILSELQEIRCNTSKKFTTFSVGYIGGVNEKRCILELIAAIERLNESGKKIEFHCVGGTNSVGLKRELNRLSSRHEWLKFYGVLPPSEGWRIISKCHVGVALLLPIPNYIDSYPTKLFEYIGMGLPVITSDFELYKSIVDKFKVGFCVSPTDTVEISDAILKLMDKELNAAFVNNTDCTLVGRFDWDIEFDKLQNFYNEIV